MDPLVTGKINAGTKKTTTLLKKNSISWDYGSAQSILDDVMTFEEYLENLNALAEAFPEINDYAVVQYTAGDLYEEVAHYAQVGKWDPLRAEFKPGSEKANSVCIN